MIHHLALGSCDVAGLAAFYEQALGLVRIKEHRDEAGLLRSIWLRLGPGSHAVLMIEKTDQPRSSDRAHAGVVPGWFLLAFEVSAAERAAAERRLEQAGATLEGRTEFSSYARDPEGNRFAISCYPLE